MTDFSKTEKIEIISDEKVVTTKVELSEPKLTNATESKRANSSDTDSDSELNSSSSKRPLLSKKRSSRQPSGEMSIYNKIMLLKTLKETNCNPKCKKELKSNFRKKIGFNDVKNFLAKEAHDAQSIASEDNILTEFDNPRHQCENLVNYVRQRGQKSIGYDSAVVLKTIEILEEHPQCEEVGGVDIKQIYHILTNLSLGLPVEEPTDETADFLHEIYDELLKKVSSEECEADRNFLQKFVNNEDVIAPAQPIENYDFYKLIKGAFDTLSFNPLQIPLSFLVKEK